MPQTRKDIKREDTDRPVYGLRSAVTELVHWMREWENLDTGVVTQALWLITLDGAPNSGVPLGTSAKVLRLIRDVVNGKVHPKHALELLKGWEDGQAD